MHRVVGYIIFLVISGCVSQPALTELVVDGTIDCQDLIAGTETFGELVELTEAMELELRAYLPSKVRRSSFCWFEIPKGHFVAQNYTGRYAFGRLGNEWFLVDFEFKGPSD